MEPTPEPIAEVSSASLVSTRIVRGLIAVAEQSGAPRAPLVAATGLDAARLECDDVCIPRVEVYGLIELVLDLTQDPALGLHWAERMCVTTFNPLSQLIAHSGTLREGLRTLLHFHRLLCQQPSFQLIESDDLVTVRCASVEDSPIRVQRFISEVQLAGFMRVLRGFNPHARPERACFEYAAPSHESEYTRVFDGRAQFAQACTSITFDRALLDTVSPHKDDEVHNALRSVAEQRVQKLAQPASFAQRVRDLLVQQRATHRTEMSTVARALGVSTRSLRRRLVAEGTSYNVVVGEALAHVAQQLLRDKQLTIQGAAYEMGFADSCTFHRAFKRWTQMTPTAYRKQQLGY